MSNIFENKGAMAATIVVAASDSLNQGAANYVCDGVADDVEIQAAIDAISASGVRGTIHLIGHIFNCAAPLVFRSNVDIEGDNAYIDVNDTGANWWAFYFFNVTDAHIKNITFHTGAVQAEQQCLVCRGTTGDRVLFENCKFYADKNYGAYFFETEHSKYVNCEAFGGTNGGGWHMEVSTYSIFERCKGTGGSLNTGTQGFNIIGNTHPILIDCEGYGGTGVTTKQVGLVIADGAYPLVIGGYFEGGASGSYAFGIWIYNRTTGVKPDENPDPSSTNIPVLIGVRCKAGGSTGDSDGLRTTGWGRPIINSIYAEKGTYTGNHGVDTEDNAAPVFNSGEIYGGLAVSGGSNPIFNGTTIHGDPRAINMPAISVGGEGSAPILNGVLATPVSFPALWWYDDANNGRFQPFAGHPYQVVQIHVDIIVANPGVTLNLGTSIGGSEIAANIPIGAVSIQYFNFNRVELAAGAWLYATPSAPIADDDIFVEYAVVTNYATCQALRLDTGGFARIVNSLLQSNGASDAVYLNNLALTVLNWVIEGSTLETFDPVNQYAINAAAAVTNAPVKRCTLISRTNNITSFCIESYRQHADIFMDVLAASANHVGAWAGTGAEQVIVAGITQPDIPRNLTVSCTNNAAPSGDVVIVGVDAKGNAVTEAFTIVPAGVATGNQAFATITSITIPATVLAADTVSIGIGSKLGLSNVIYAIGDVYKLKRNNADSPPANYTVNATYHTVDPTPGGAIVGGEDFTCWYRSNLNIVS